jgi:hypothetical protein
MRDSSTKEWPESTVPSTGSRPPGATRMASPTDNSSAETDRIEPARRTETSRGRNSRRSRIALRPRPTVRPSSTSATRTNKVMTKAVKNSPMAAAATMAIVIDSSIVMRRSTILSKASFRIGQPPIRRPTTPMTLIAGNGSQTRNHTAAAAMATRAIRAASSHSKGWSWSCP